ncbi:MAG: universal stress protein [Actinomycetes bacterium]
MRNPVRTEADAFRFLLRTIVYFALIVSGGLINRWLGLGVFILATVIVAARLSRKGPHIAPAFEASGAHPGTQHRVLVVADETVNGDELIAEIVHRASRNSARVLIVAPALNSYLRHWTSDEDGARLAAQERIDASLVALRAVGVDATGEIGSDDPLQAIEDAIRSFAPDEIVIATHPEGRSNWLERDLVAHTRERFALPVAHVVVDPDVD